MLPGGCPWVKAERVGHGMAIAPVATLLPSVLFAGWRTWAYRWLTGTSEAAWHSGVLWQSGVWAHT